MAHRNAAVKNETPVVEAITLPPVPVLVRDWTKEVTASLETFGSQAEKLHGTMVELIEFLSTSPVGDIAKCEALRIALSRSTPGLDRQQLATWIMASTPIKIILAKGTDPLTLKFDAKISKRREADGLKKWDADQLRERDWTQCEKAPARAPKKADIEKAKAALAKSLVKLALESLPDDADDTKTAVASVKALGSVLDGIETWMPAAIQDYLESDGWTKYKALRTQARSDERSALGDKAKSEKEAKEAFNATLAEGIKEAREGRAIMAALFG